LPPFARRIRISIFSISRSFPRRVKHSNKRRPEPYIRPATSRGTPSMFRRTIAPRILSAPRAGLPDALHERKAPDSLNPIGAPPGTRIPRRSAPVLRRCTNLQLFRQVLQELPHFGVAHICGVAFLMERGRQYSHVYVCAGICGLNLFVCCIFNRIALRLPYVRLSSVGVERAQQIDAR